MESSPVAGYWDMDFAIDYNSDCLASYCTVVRIGCLVDIRIPVTVNFSFST
jgi:hypothetical protein